MINAHEFADRQAELMAEFAKFVLENPDVDEALPENSYVYFEVAGEPEFSAHSRDLASRRKREEGVDVVCVHVRGIAPPQGSRLIDPRVVPVPSGA